MSEKKRDRRKKENVKGRKDSAKVEKDERRGKIVSIFIRCPAEKKPASRY